MLGVTRMSGVNYMNVWSETESHLRLINVFHQSSEPVKSINTETVTSGNRSSVI